VLKEYLINWRSCWQIPLAGIIGGLIANLFKIPLPWILGSLIGVVALQCLIKKPTYIPILGGRKLGQCIIGINLGLHFTQQVIAEILANLSVIFLCVFCTLLLAIIGILILRYSNLDKATIFFASLPGGASEMVNFGIKYGAKADKIAAAHSLRLLLVVFVVPPVFSFMFEPNLSTTHSIIDLPKLALIFSISCATTFLWIKIKQPNPWVLGSLFTCAAISILYGWNFSIPPIIGMLGQWLIGCALGCYFSRDFFISAPKFLLQIALITILMIFTTLITSMIIASFTNSNVLVLILGMMPGGITELTLTAEALNLSVELVASMHVLRLIALMFLALPIYKLWCKFSTQMPIT